MPYDSNGVWSNVSTYHVNTGDTLLPNSQNPVWEDAAVNGFSAVLVRDGRAPMTGNLDMGGNKIVNVGAGTGPNDVVTFRQIGSINPTNYLINGDFLFWQRGTTQTTSDYGSDDRWINLNVGTTKTHTQQTFPIGQTAVPGNPLFFSRTAVTSVAGANNYCAKSQRIEDVRPLSGKTITLTFWAKADSAKNMSVEFVQNFGTGGSPSSPVLGIGVTTCPLLTTWKKFSFTVNMPSITGKTLGSGNSGTYLYFYFDAGSSLNGRTNSLGQQSGTFDIAHVSINDSDTTSIADPFEFRLWAAELALCQRYFQRMKIGGIYGYNACGQTLGDSVNFNTPRRTTAGVSVIGWDAASNISAPSPQAISAQGFLITAVVSGTGVGFITGITLDCTAEL